jgi:hypothetical protein
LTLADNVVLSGPWLMPYRGKGNYHVDISGFNSIILLNPLFTIQVMGKSAGIEGLAILNKDVFNSPSPTTLRMNLDRRNLFLGAGVTVGDGTSSIADDFSLHNVFIGGFHTGISSDGNARPRWNTVSGDNINDVYIAKCFDLDHIFSLHFWPGLTSSGGSTAHKAYTITNVTNNGAGACRVEVSEDHILENGDTDIVINGVVGVTSVNRTHGTVTRIDARHFDCDGSTFGGAYVSGGTVHVLVFKRHGIGVNCAESVDWAQLIDVFVYGKQIAGIKINNSNNATLISCGVDNYAPIGDTETTGILVTGTSRAASLIGGQSAAHGANVKIDTAAPSENVTMITGHRSWGSTQYAYHFVNGRASLSNCQIQFNQTIRVEATADDITWHGGDTYVMNAVSYATGAKRIEFIGVLGQTIRADLVGRAASGTTIIERISQYNASPTANDAVARIVEQTDSSGALVETGRQSVRAPVVTAGSVSSQMLWALRGGGVYTDRLWLTAGTLSPVVNDGLSLGFASGGQWADLFLASGGVINWADGTYRITQSGANLIFSGGAHFSPGASQTPANNGQVTFELTNNTTLTFKAKGSDGTVRSGTVTLS